MANNNVDRFQTFVMAILLIMLLGWLLEAGKGIALPVLGAIMWLYIITGAANALGRWPLVKYLPLFVRRMLIFIAFVVGLTMFGGALVVTVERILENIPLYQSNLETMMVKTLDYFGIENPQELLMFQNIEQGQIRFQQVLAAVVISVSGIGGTVSLILIYATFLMAERGSFSAKLALALPSKHEVDRTQAILHDINNKIGDYLAAKTLINIILAVVSFAIIRAFGIPNALFWALLIGLLNYIPYVGSLIAVLFPVILTLAHSGSIERTLSVAAALTLAQWLVGNVLEPRMLGKQMNLSPFVVIVSLSVWYALLGVGGAILAVPLTSMIAIILAAYEPTKPYAILLAQDIEAVKANDLPKLDPKTKVLLP
ncbi:MAG: AI-2E family transporter [Rhizobiales bacterium]|nr:AI-2E family transporter [Hyphomicrobiales bacterium]NRB15330.1 AI-2E family transporter [Hyphomicrobiales bacterium]